MRFGLSHCSLPRVGRSLRGTDPDLMSRQHFADVWNRFLVKEQQQWTAASSLQSLPSFCHHAPITSVATIKSGSLSFADGIFRFIGTFHLIQLSLSRLPGNCGVGGDLIKRLRSITEEDEEEGIYRYLPNKNITGILICFLIDWLRCGGADILRG